ncbi:unnamed protein product [Phytomonas sp. Hart1]|nr:unnamed protein product [Phytomonas sp. Hart1]|eukprot:CCW71483.1 unnamed protein product [Phytomonas sp. isolate Hart1]
MGLDRQSTEASYLDLICTSVGCGVECGKGILCNLSNKVTNGVRGVVDTIYGSKNDSPRFLAANAPSNGSFIASLTSRELKEVPHGASNRVKLGLFNGPSNNFKLNPFKNSSPDNKKFKESAILGAKIAAAVLVVAGAAQFAYSLHQNNKKKNINKARKVK